jgi:uncharacterized protein YjbI with pentapeptide repeats
MSLYELKHFLMSTLINETVAAGDYSNKKLQNASFRKQDLSHARFSGSDLRSADFGGANLTGTDFTNVRTGIRPLDSVLLFLAALGVSLLSGYLAMLTGRTVKFMLTSGDPLMGAAGIITMVLSVLFIVYAYVNGGGTTIRNLIIPACVIALVLGLVAYFTQIGTGLGMLYIILSTLLLTIMFIVGTMARAVAGTLSNILFIIVALSGGLFSKSLEGGIGTAIMAISCALISKRALSGAKGFEALRRISCAVTRKFGTSFRNTNLTGANFSQSKIKNADFTNADLSEINWGDSKKINCINDENKLFVIRG